jgi:hypothetical protein
MLCEDSGDPLRVIAPAFTAEEPIVQSEPTRASIATQVPSAILSRRVEFGLALGAGFGGNGWRIAWKVVMLPAIKNHSHLYCQPLWNEDW